MSGESLTGERLYTLWRHISNHTFSKSNLAPWRDIGEKHKRAWNEFAARLREVEW
jgi:hypothetical protein